MGVHEASELASLAWTPSNALISTLNGKGAKTLYLFETLLLLQGTSGEHKTEKDRANLASHFSNWFLFLVVSQNCLIFVQCRGSRWNRCRRFFQWHVCHIESIGESIRRQIGQNRPKPEIERFQAIWSESLAFGVEIRCQTKRPISIFPSSSINNS